MTERPRFFDDLAGMAGGAMSALNGLRDEAEAMMRARCDEAIRKFDLVKRDELDAMTEIATRAREGQLAAEARLAALEARLAALEAKADPASAQPHPFQASPAIVLPHDAPPREPPRVDPPTDTPPVSPTA